MGSLYRLMFLVLLILVAISVIRALLAGAASHPGADRRRNVRGGRLVKDPVCGTYVTPEGALSAGGPEPVYFCSEACRDRFTAGR